MIRRWCVAWDARPFGVRIDSRHFTRSGAGVRLMRHTYPGYYVTTIEKAVADDARILDRMHRGMDET